MNRHIYLLSCLALLGLLALSNSHAAAVNSGNVEAELVSEVDAVVPGESFWIALRQEIRPGWHTYWRNPGDSGAPTTLTFDLPTGFTAGGIEWPWPERIPYGPLVNFGYHGEVYFPVRITAPAELVGDQAGDQVVLRALGEWLVCEEVCIPEDAQLELVLPIRNEASIINADIFTQARQRIPEDIGVASSYAVADEGIVLSLELPGLVPDRIQTVAYFSYGTDVIDNTARQDFRLTGQGLDIGLKPGYDFAPGANLDGIVVITEDSGERLTTAFVITPDRSAMPAASMPASELSLVTALLFALLGGVILNLMPCVFPVLSIKILSLMQHVDREASHMRAHGWVYAAGVVASFVAIALVLILLRAGGAQIGWGFQLQSPLIVGLLAYLFVLIGLNLAGYFEFGTRLMDWGSTHAGRQGYSGSFATGVLATIVAAPCTAPFMASAVGFALTRDNVTSIAIFAALGAGMAVPYLLLCYAPALLSRMPRPGPWMLRFREALAFPMFASAIWLVWVLSQQSGPQGVLIVLAGMLTLAAAIWLWRVRPTGGIGLYLVSAMVVAMVGASLYLPSTLGRAIPLLEATGAKTATRAGANYAGPGWETYSAERLAAARKTGPVFVNFTAAWCITCKVNEVVGLDSAEVRAAFENKGVTYLKGDWTNEDPAITRALGEYQRSGVPLYLLYTPGQDRAKVLPQVLTESIVLRAIESL